MPKDKRTISENQKLYGLTVSTRLDEDIVNDIRVSAQKLGLTVSKYIGMLVRKGQYETELIDSLRDDIANLKNEIQIVKTTRAEAVGALIKKTAKNDKEVNKYIEYYNEIIGMIEDRRQSAKRISE